MYKIAFLVTFALFLLKAPAQNYTRVWMNCSITTDQNESLYGYCVIYVDQTPAAKRYTASMQWANPYINPICSVKLLESNQAIYTTINRNDTVDVKIADYKNEKMRIEITFNPNAQKEMLTFVLEDNRKCGLLKRK